MAQNLLIFWVFSSYRPHLRSCAVSLTTPYIYQLKLPFPGPTPVMNRPPSRPPARSPFIPLFFFQL